MFKIKIKYSEIVQVILNRGKHNKGRIKTISGKRCIVHRSLMRFIMLAYKVKGYYLLGTYMPQWRKFILAKLSKPFKATWEIKLARFNMQYFPNKANVFIQL